MKSFVILTSMRQMRLRGLRKFFRGIHINRIIRILIFSDFLIWSGFGLMNPILAVFMTEQIQGGNLAVAGFASSIYLLVKSSLQIPIARLIDLRKGEGDDYWVLLVGSGLVGFSPFLYLAASLPWHLYLIQAFFGLGCALTFASWDALFTRHLDKDEVALEWSSYYTVVDLGGAIAAAGGGLIAQTFGFRPLFFLVGFTTSLGALSLLGLAAHLTGRVFKSSVTPPK